PIVARAQELNDRTAEGRHEYADEARHHVAVAAVRMQQAQRQLRQEEKPEATSDEIGAEIEERQSLHALLRPVGARSTSPRATVAAKQRAPLTRAAPETLARAPAGSASAPRRSASAGRAVWGPD